MHAIYLHHGILQMQLKKGEMITSVTVCVALVLNMWLLCVCPQLKWNLPDETGGEVITLYQLKVKPLPPSFTDAPEPDSEVGLQDHGMCCYQCTCHLSEQCLWSIVVDTRAIYVITCARWHHGWLVPFVTECQSKTPTACSSPLRMHA